MTGDMPLELEEITRLRGRVSDLSDSLHRQQPELDALRAVAEAARKLIDANRVPLARDEPVDRMAHIQHCQRQLMLTVANLDALSKPPDPYKHKTGRPVL